jgi:hypothetical protein
MQQHWFVTLVLLSCYFNKTGNMALRTVDGTEAMCGYGGTGYGYTVIICVT